MGTYNHVLSGGVAHNGGTVTGTGTWQLSGNKNVKLTSTGVYLRVVSGTTTATGAVSVAAVRVEAGATWAGGSQSVVLQDSASATKAARCRITGFGTVGAVVPASVAVHCGPGIIDGTGNDASKIIFDPWPTVPYPGGLG